jgi:hypothetical protein
MRRVIFQKETRRPFPPLHQAFLSSLKTNTEKAPTDKPRARMPEPVVPVVKAVPTLTERLAARIEKGLTE